MLKMYDITESIKGIGDGEMGQDAKRKFTALDAEIQCECKTITALLDYSMDMHNHDGYEVLLVLGGHYKFLYRIWGQQAGAGRSGMC